VSVPRLVPPFLPAGTLAARSQPRLDTDGGLLLRPWLAEDAPVLAAAYEDPAIQHWHHRSMPLAEAEGWIAATATVWRDETDAEWAVADGDRVVGRVALRGILLAVGQAEISYWTCPDARQRGVATAAVGRLADWAFDTAGFWRLQIKHSVHNPGSCQVATRAGFTEVAELSRQHLHADGWHDVHVHSRHQAAATPRR
jgi:RimJ/RimL family protein N-acetyltransferase